MSGGGQIWGPLIKTDLVGALGTCLGLPNGRSASAGKNP